MPMTSPRRNDRTRPSNAMGSLSFQNEAQTYEVEVTKALNQWAVSVTRLEDKHLICQDFFSRRWEALARAEDFLKLLNRKEPPPGW